MNSTERFRGCLLGLACGDAVGTTVEFQPRGTFPPVTDMLGGGPFDLKAGQWTDDTSMALCLAASLVETGGFDAADQIRRYVRWWRDGYMSSTGRCFDIGNTTLAALAKFERTGEPYCGATDNRSAGNGCIMRLAPVPMFYHHDYDLAVTMSGDSSRTTHGALECVDACRLLGAVLHSALAGASKEDILFGHDIGVTETIDAIRRGEYRTKQQSEIRGSGYVVDSLEAALWCFLNTDSFEAAILAAVNLGDDADTTAAVCGQVAGAFYGEIGIPAAWLSKLALADKVRTLADELRTANQQPQERDGTSRQSK
jgi:ADP-ribosyl-[dinitrogen reductase] hydrolase